MSDNNLINLFKYFHITFRHSTRISLNWLKPARKIEVFQLKSIEMFLEMKRIQLIEGDVWGHRKDIKEYYDIPV